MLWYCAKCTAAYSVGAPRCPHCKSTKHSETPMPKATKGGASNAWADDAQETAPEVKETPEPAAEPVQDAPAPDATQQIINFHGGAVLPSMSGGSGQS